MSIKLFFLLLLTTSMAKAQIQTYTSEEMPGVQLTREIFKLKHFPFDKSLNKSHFFKSLYQIRKITSRPAGLKELIFKKNELKEISRQKVELSILGTYRVDNQKIKFEEIQVIEGGHVEILRALAEQSTVIDSEKLRKFFQKNSKLTRWPAEDKSETEASTIQITCSDCEGSLLKAPLQKIQAHETKDEICQQIDEKYRDKKISKTERFDVFADESVFSSASKIISNCVIKATDQFNQDILGLTKLMSLSLLEVIRSVTGAVKSSFAIVLSADERNQMIEAVKNTLSYGIQNTTSGLQYLSKNSVTEILHQPRDESFVKKSAQDFFTKVFANSLRSQKNIWMCLAEVEKEKYLCEWINQALQTLSQGTISVSLDQSREKLILKYKKTSY